MEYLGGVLGSLLTTLFLVFAIATVGYLVGGVKIKGISLGTAGVLLIALVVGIVFSLVGDKANEKITVAFSIGSFKITMYNDSVIASLDSLKVFQL